jgi:glycosyltransferase involved in cell wall biosynthesis
MNVLYLTPMLPYPLYSGGQVRLYNLLKRLSGKHRIHLISFIRKESERKELAALAFLNRIDLFSRGRRLRWEYLTRALVQNRSLLTASYSAFSVSELVRKLAGSGQYDLIHIEPFYAYPVFEKMPIPHVVTEHNIEYQVYQDYAKTLRNPLVKTVINREARLIFNEEIRAVRNSRQLITVSSLDKDHFSRFTNSNKITVVPNGVDTEWFQYEKKVIPKKGLKILFVGNLTWHPNLEAIIRLGNINWKKLASIFPGLTVTVVGKGATGGVKSLMASAGISYRDSVTDIREAYRESQIFLALMSVRGGSKYKCLEAMGSGVPVLSTAAGMAGLGAEAGKEYLEVAQEDDIVNAVKKLRTEPGYVRQMTVNARNLIEKKYSWDSIVRIQENVWESLI